MSGWNEGLQAFFRIRTATGCGSVEDESSPIQYSMSDSLSDVGVVLVVGRRRRMTCGARWMMWEPNGTLAGSKGETSTPRCALRRRLDARAVSTMPVGLTARADRAP